MHLHLSEVTIVFFIFSFLGWCMEVFLKLVDEHIFVNRGFLIGPYCPVYGEIVIDESADDVLDGQINIFDELGDYSNAGKLKTTGCDRTGCIFCMFGCHLEKEPNRFQRLKETHPRQYDYCINGGEMVNGKCQPNKEGLGLGKVLDYIGVPYE